MPSENALGNAGYAITGSGGGGSGGQYVFASLDELDVIIAEWTKIRDDVLVDGNNLRLARAALHPPAKDIMSELQSAATRGSIETAISHNVAMFKYANSYVGKLTAARGQYATDDELNAARLRSINDD